MPATVSTRPIDQHRPLKVIYIGAGISGIVAAIEFIRAVPSIELVIYEKNPEVGGTWYENRYPGCACDIPAHAYQLSFESSVEWKEFYAGSTEILDYWKRVVEKYNVRKHIRFQHQCTEARWDEETSKWHVKFLKCDLTSPLLVEDQADVLITGTGVLNQWRWPNIPGLHDFKGTIVHTANWNLHSNVEGKTVAVIGAGSSGIQVVPALVDKVKRMDHYVRGKTWISTQLSQDILQQNAADGSFNFHYTEEQKMHWKDDPIAYLDYRRSLESRLQGNHEITFRDNERHKHARETYESDMVSRLKTRPDILNLLKPDFPPLCKRLTPGPGYLEALTAENVDVISEAIVSIDANGILAQNGRHRPVDVIICATGFETSPGSGFPIYGQDGVNLREKQARRPQTYLSLSTNNFPNFFQSLGPNSFVGTGSQLIVIESIHRYVAQILRRMAYGDIKTIQPKRKQVENFTKYCEKYFQQTVFSSECVSWYKTVEKSVGGKGKAKERVTALWPGSSLHVIQALQDVRWDDFEIEKIDNDDFAWFGDGSTLADRNVTTNIKGLSWYLQDSQFLHQPLHKDITQDAFRTKLEAEMEVEAEAQELECEKIVLTDQVASDGDEFEGKSTTGTLTTDLTFEDSIDGDTCAPRTPVPESIAHSVEFQLTNNRGTSDEATATPTNEVKHANDVNDWDICLPLRSDDASYEVGMERNEHRLI